MLKFDQAIMHEENKTGFPTHIAIAFGAKEKD